ncbi:MAG: carboxylesterase family protein [Bacteroidales bacterium]|nr:carboxylesterase family protein [Bacteroidales bacterium]
MKKILFAAIVAMTLASCGHSKQGMSFNPNDGQEAELTMPDGEVVRYTAYERLYYVKNVEDTAYQYLNVYVPEGATKTTPILLRTYIGGYMAAKARGPEAGDATGRALKEGYVVVIPGSRGRNSVQGGTYTGRAPKGLLDLKAAVRYLRLFDREMPGNAERIIIDGTSAGGAMAALVGATGNHPAYNDMLTAMGAAKEKDDVYAAVCFCPITDLEHADMAYEWLYNGTSSRQRSAQLLPISNQLKEQFPNYINSLNLKDWNGTPVTADNYMDLLRRELIRSAQTAKNAGADISDSLGFSFNEERMGGMPPINGGKKAPLPAMRAPQPQRGEYVVGLDIQRYLNYVASTQPLKTAPAFDTKGVLGQLASAENEEFGGTDGSSVNFTVYSAYKNGKDLPKEVVDNVYLMNPMNFIGDIQAADGKSKAKNEHTLAPHWYIRHGARDRDTGFPVPLNLALKLNEAGCDVNFIFAWNRPHSGDYALDELFGWLKSIM